MIRTLIIGCVGPLLYKFNTVFQLYMNQRIIKRLGKCGMQASIHYPYKIIGEKNIFLEDGAIIGAGSTIFTKRAKIHFGMNSFTGPNLTIITGDHPYLPGSYMLNLRKVDLAKTMDITSYDKDVVIEQDVWLGVNVTILKGVRIGRGAVVAANSLIINDIPPYSISGGVPAKVIKFKWTKEEILKHEKFIVDDEKQRFSSEAIEVLLNSYKH